LNVFNIHMLPLREHMEDVPPMMEHMIEEMNRKHGRKVSGVSPAMLEKMMAHDWPGNARELRNTVERAVILCPDGELLEPGHLPPGFGKRQAAAEDLSAADMVAVRVGTTVEQDARGGDSGHQPEDPAQQAEGVWTDERDGYAVRPHSREMLLHIGEHFPERIKNTAATYEQIET